MNDSVKKTVGDEPIVGAETPAEPKPRRRRTTAKATDASEATVETTEATAEPVKAVKPRAKRVTKKADVAPAGEASQTQLFAEPEAAPAKPKRTRAKPKGEAESEAVPAAEVQVEPVVAAAQVPVAQSSELVAERDNSAAAAQESAVTGESSEAGDAGQERPRREDRPRGERGNRFEKGARGERGDRNQNARDNNQRRGPGQQGQPGGGRRDAGEASYQFEDIISGQLDRDEEDEAVAPLKRVLPPQAETPKLHKVLAQAGVGSRLEMEQLILEGRISVNNEPAHIGQRVQFGDQVKINGKPIRFRIEPPPARVIAYHKPVGEVVTHDDPQNRPTVFRKLPRLQQGKWQSVGRLDLNTEGLLLFTSSGELANKLMHPRFGLEREYAVRVLGALSNEEKERLLAGVQLEDGMAQFGSIEDGGGEGANHWYRVTISEGRNREVRRMMESVGHAVSRLIRIRYGAMMLPRGLKRGAWLELDERDIRALMQAAGAGAMIDGQQRQPQPVGRNDRSRGRGNNRGPLGNRGGSGGGNRDRNDGGRQGQGQGYFQGQGQGTGGGDRRSAANPNRDRNNNRGGNKSGGSSQPDPMKTSVGYIGSDSFSRHRQQQRNNGGPRRRDR